MSARKIIELEKIKKNWEKLKKVKEHKRWLVKKLIGLLK
jgi:hypothetical protein